MVDHTAKGFAKCVAALTGGLLLHLVLLHGDVRVSHTATRRSTDRVATALPTDVARGTWCIRKAERTTQVG